MAKDDNKYWYNYDYMKKPNNYKIISNKLIGYDIVFKFPDNITHVFYLEIPYHDKLLAVNKSELNDLLYEHFKISGKDYELFTSRLKRDGIDRYVISSIRICLEKSEYVKNIILTKNRKDKLMKIMKHTD